MKRLVVSFTLALAATAVSIPEVYAAPREEIKLTTIIPDQQVLRVKKGIISTAKYRQVDFPDGNIPASSLIVAEGRVGIGTTNPQASLHIGGTPGPNNGIMFPDGTIQNTATDTGYLLYRDVRASGTNGVSLTTGSWQTRPLTQETADIGSFGSLSSNMITLAAGTYECYILCPLCDDSYEPRSHQARLYNVTDASVIAYGTSTYSDLASYDTSESTIVAAFTLSGAKRIRIEHRSSSSSARVNIGRATGFGGEEVYTIAQFRKIK